MNPLIYVLVAIALTSLGEPLTAMGQFDTLEECLEARSRMVEVAREADLVPVKAECFKIEYDSHPIDM